MRRGTLPVSVYDSTVMREAPDAAGHLLAATTPHYRGPCRGGPRCDARMGKIRPPQFYGGVWRRSGPRTSTSVSRTSTYRDRYQEAFRELIEVKMEGLPIEPRYCPHQYPDGRRKEERTTVGTRRRKKA